MNKIIKEQLSKVKNVKIQFDDSTNYILINKVSYLPSSNVIKGHFYKIELLSNLDNVKDMLRSNYNLGKHPTNTHYTAEVVNILSNMVKFDMVSDTDRFFGWLPMDCFKVESEIL